MKTVPKLEQWSVQSGDDDPFTAPERQRRLVVGCVFGDPDFTDGKSLDVPLRSAEGKRITSADRRQYDLGEPDARYVAWLKSTGISFDPETPIRVVETFDQTKGPPMSGEERAARMPAEGEA